MRYKLKGKNTIIYFIFYKYKQNNFIFFGVPLRSLRSLASRYPLQPRLRRRVRCYRSRLRAPRALGARMIFLVKFFIFI